MDILKNVPLFTFIPTMKDFNICQGPQVLCECKYDDLNFYPTFEFNILRIIWPSWRLIKTILPLFLNSKVEIPLISDFQVSKNDLMRFGQLSEKKWLNETFLNTCPLSGQWREDWLPIQQMSIRFLTLT